MAQKEWAIKELQLQGDHTQPPWEGLRKGSTGEENSADSRPLGFRRNECGFRPRSCGTLDQLYTLCRVLEGLWEFAQPVHMCFVDLEKAFDRVPRGILWGVLREYGVRGPLLRAVRSLYDWSRSLVCIAGSKSDLFPVHVGLLAGLPFVTGPVHESLWTGFLGIARGRRESGLGTTGFHLCSFADDVVLLASSGQDLQHVLEQVCSRVLSGWN
ncbi:hypothetical protein L3Q82_007415 [Scortum barcoo]|uniref:Uncharacterized protein n=1 Tax=Scortum barcoo TaxID=214431 RepID=A0ACB8WT54_9TELE|nr:hypothetical protein L3Q82_007415 [Scortum barcoo]